jgi:hypothetical protein
MIGEQVAAAVLALRANDGRDSNPTLSDLNPPAPGPGVWQPNPTGLVLGLRLPASSGTIKPKPRSSIHVFRVPCWRSLTVPTVALPSHSLLF